MDGTTNGFAPHGRHLIAGEWVAAEATFRSDPAQGAAHAFAVGTAALVNAAVEAAEVAFWSYGYSDIETRAGFLDTIAEQIDARGAEIGKGWAGSRTMGAGQFCTNPGIAVIATGPDGGAFVAAPTRPRPISGRPRSAPWRSAAFSAR